MHSGGRNGERRISRFRERRKLHNLERVMWSLDSVSRVVTHRVLRAQINIVLAGHRYGN